MKIQIFTFGLLFITSTHTAYAGWECSPQYDSCRAQNNSNLEGWRKNKDFYSKQMDGIDQRIQQCNHSVTTEKNYLDRLDRQIIGISSKRSAYQEQLSDFSYIKQREERAIQLLKRHQNSMDAILSTIIAALRSDLNGGTNQIDTLLTQEQYAPADQNDPDDKIRHQVTLEVLGDLKNLFQNNGNNRQLLLTQIQAGLYGNGTSDLTRLKQLNPTTAAVLQVSQDQNLNADQGARTLFTGVLAQAENTLSWITIKYNEYRQKADPAYENSQRAIYNSRNQSMNNLANSCRAKERIRAETPAKIQEAQNQMNICAFNLDKGCHGSYCHYHQPEHISGRGERL